MNINIKYRFNSLEDYLSSRPLDIDGILDDGWGAKYPVKGRQIEAFILFIDISYFSKRTYNLSPFETLIFVNRFFSWISAEALRDKPGIIDKYIGDEMMVLFSKEFGSKDPFLDAIQTARFMVERDALAFCPHIGIAGGKVAVGYVGTPLKYNCSVFGRPVAIASRCSSIKPKGDGSTSIIFPSNLGQNRDFNKIFAELPENNFSNQNLSWKILSPRNEEVKNMPDIEVIEIVRKVIDIPSVSVEEMAKDSLKELKKTGRINPIRYEFESSNE